MKKSGSIILVLFLVAASAVSAFAGGNHQNVTLTKPAVINGTELKPGDYKVQWTGSGDAVQVSFLQGKTTIATAPAKLIENDPSVYSDSVIVRKGADGSRILGGLQFGSKKQSLMFESNGSTTGQ